MGRKYNVFQFSFEILHIILVLAALHVEKLEGLERLQNPNKRINDLKKAGSVEEDLTNTGRVLRLTSKGKSKISFLMWPRYLFLLLAVLTFANVYWGVLGALSIFHVQPWNILLVGIISLLAIIFLYRMYEKSEEQLLQIGRPNLEG